MQGIKIVATGRALPQKVVTNDDLSRLVDTSDEWISTRTGIRQRYFCEEETCQSLAILAAKRAVEKAEIDKKQIGLVIVATATGDYVFPSVACMVQNALGLETEVLAFDLSAACSGFLYGLGVCRSVLSGQDKKYALLIGSEQMSRILDMEDRSTCVLFGDGAAAAVLTLEENEFYQKAWSDGNDEVLSCKGVGYKNQHLLMEGSKVFKFAVKAIAQGIDEILEKAEKTIKDIDVNGKRVLLRVDFNVPLDDNGNITDATRIRVVMPTIKYLLMNGAKVIVCSHLGRPNGEVNKKYSLLPVAKYLVGELLGRVFFAGDCIGPEAETKAKLLKDGEVLLLENLRFHREETDNDPEFSKKLASFGEIFVNDAFGTAHRAHASTEGVTHYLPAVSGFLIEKELKFLDEALQNPERPFMAILGGSKVSDKIGVIESLINKVDAILIGGGMAYTFLKALGYNVGNSLCEDDKINLAMELMEKAKEKGVKFMLPIDNRIGKDFTPETECRIVPSAEIPDGWQGLDIGPETVKLYAEELKNAKTIVWNGPLGVFELEKFAIGTNEIAKVLGDIDAVKIIGGGDSASAVEKAGVAEKMTHISTGGGASLEFLEGKKLPGVECLLNK